MTVSTGQVAPPSTTSATPEPALQTPGALLQQERTRRGLSVHQAAEGLHLDPWIVEAMEANQFLSLGAPVYAKGYLRKYAVLLGLAPDVVVTRYDALSDTPVVPTPVPPITAPPERPKWPKYVAWALLAAIVVGLGFAAFVLLMPSGQSRQPAADVAPPPASIDAPVTQPVGATPQTSEAAPAQVTIPATTLVDAPTQTVPTQTVPTQSSATQGAPTQTAPVAQPESPVGSAASVQLRLEFQAASWAEVYDANGQRLFYDVGQPGRSQVMSGSAPLNVVLGVASAVNVVVNDAPIVVPRRANRDATRFRVGPNGVVQ